jgi:hypothetical protein
LRFSDGGSTPPASTNLSIAFAIRSYLINTFNGLNS